MSKLELKIHPPVILMLCCVLAWLLSNSVPAFIEISRSVMTGLAIVLVMVGIIIAISAIFEFRRVETTVNPTKPNDASSLVTAGIFRFTRNPMYLALLFLLTGWVIFLGNVWAGVVLIIFVAYINRFQIRPEEKVLSNKFGEAYSHYCREVRRWI